MRILQVIPFFVPAWGFGGPVKVCFDISRKLVEKGHTVTVATTDAYEYNRRIDKLCETIEGIKIIRFRNISNHLTKGYNFYLPSGFKKWIKKNINNFDIVHLHAFFTYQNIVASRYCQKYQIPYVLHLHESLVPQPILGKVWLKKIFNYLFGRKLLLNTTRIFVVSLKEKDGLASYMPELNKKIEIIPNCIDISEKRSLARVNRAKYGLKKTDKVILTLSRLSYIKGINLLIRAFGELVKQDPGFKLIIAGPDEGGQLDKLESLVEKFNLKRNILFPGLVEGRNKQKLFSIADVFTLFSRYESFSMTTLEALEYNLPVCLSKEVGIANEVLKFNCGAFITDPEDAQKSASQLERVYNDRKLLAKNCKLAIKQFDINNVMDKLISIYKKMV